MTDLRHFAARYRLGLQDSKSLVRFAASLLEGGHQTPAVIQLSILESPVMAEAGPIFERICTELKVPVPKQDEAIDELLRRHFESIASGSCGPREGLEAVMRELYWPHLADEPCKKYVGDARGIEHLIGAYWSYDDLMSRPREVSWDGKYGAEAVSRWEDSVRQYARDWIQKNEDGS
jgi:hypothetical protein